MAYLLSNICTKNYWDRTTTVEIIIGGWVVSFFWDSVELETMKRTQNSHLFIVAEPFIVN